MTKKSWRNTAIVVLLIAVFTVGTVLLAGALRGTEAYARQEAETVMLRRAMPGGKTFTAEAYTGDDAGIAAVWRTQGGAVIETVVSGYAGEIHLLVGVNDDGRVVGVAVRSLRETPGLGGRAATDAEFLGQFVGLSGTITLGDGVDGLTGATVTSRAVVRGVNAAIRFMTGADAGSSATGETDAGSSATEWEETPQNGQSGADAGSSATEWEETPQNGQSGVDAGSSATEWVDPEASADSNGSNSDASVPSKPAQQPGDAADAGSSATEWEG